MCSSCTATVERTVRDSDGVISVTANFSNGATSIMLDETRAEPQVIPSAVTTAGFEVENE